MISMVRYNAPWSELVSTPFSHALSLSPTSSLTSLFFLSRSIIFFLSLIFSFEMYHPYFFLAFSYLPFLHSLSISSSHPPPCSLSLSLTISLSSRFFSCSPSPSLSLFLPYPPLSLSIFFSLQTSAYPWQTESRGSWFWFIAVWSNFPQKILLGLNWTE